MDYGLGIDTGGTFTDAVIYDYKTKKIVDWAKKLTKKHELKQCIDNVIKVFPKEKLRNIKLISLSTTLATNAAVEGKSSRGVLVLIGCEKSIVLEQGKKYGLDTAEDIIYLDGGHDSNGEVIKEPNWEILRERIIYLKKHTDAFAVAQMWGMRNPEFEKKAKQIILKETGLSCVCAHELCSQLNYLKRAGTALLNAKLIPLTSRFLDSVKQSLKGYGINAPLVIVKGDGSLMNEKKAREKPVTTLISGPAASIIGGLNLSSKKDCIIIDMGGTTSDMALIENRVPELCEEGIEVGTYRPGIPSISITTSGLGGDSLIGFNSKDEITIGPRRVLPISWLCSEYPNVLKQLEIIHNQEKKYTQSLCEFFVLLKNVKNDNYWSLEEKEIIKALSTGPLSIEMLAEKAKTTIYSIDTERLEQQEIIMKSALTPTDLMHISKDFCKWNEKGALIGAKILAKRLNMSIDHLINAAYNNIKRQLYFNIIKMLYKKEYNMNLKDDMKELILKGYNNKNNKYLALAFNTNFALVGVGAPIHVFLKDVAKILDCDMYIPQVASVANAYGAITGDIREVENIMIKPNLSKDLNGNYICFSSNIRQAFEEYDEALSWAMEECKDIVIKNAEKNGAKQIRTFVDYDELRTKSGDEMTDLDKAEEFPLIETKVFATALGIIK